MTPLHQQLREALDRKLTATTAEASREAEAEVRDLLRQLVARRRPTGARDWQSLAAGADKD